MYNATKFGLRGFALAHRDDLHGTGVGISVVEPGFVSDAGMFADSGMPLPKGVKAVPPEKVAAKVVRAIDKDLGEVMVAPTSLKAAEHACCGRTPVVRSHAAPARNADRSRDRRKGEALTRAAQP